MTLLFFQRYFGLFLVLGLPILISSCKKEGAIPKDTPSENLVIINKINAWLEETKKADTSQHSTTTIQSIKDNLDFTKISFEKLSDKEKFCIVALKNEFQSSYNINKYKITNVVFILNENDSIRKGNIIQFLPDNSSSITIIPHNTFYKIFNHQLLDVDGKFSFLSIKDRIIWEIGYKDKKPYSYGVAEARESNSDPVGRVNECINWYLVTTYTYTDGTTYTTEQYLYTDCGRCEQTRLANGTVYRINCGGGGGGGTGTSYPVSKPVDWKVGVATGIAAGAWYVQSYETLNGVRVPGSEPDNGYFTGTQTHNGDEIFNTYPNTPSYPYGNWTRLQAANIIINSGTVESDVNGKVNYPQFPLGDVNIRGYT